MGAQNSGGGKANQRAKDSARAAFMQKHPGMFPDSIMKSRRKNKEYSNVPYTSNPGDSRWMRGMQGGVLASRIGFGSENIPADIL